MGGKLKYYLILNLTVFIWGFTGILGKEIDLDANKIVFFRMGIAFFSLVILGFFYSSKQKLSFIQLFSVLGVGVIVGIHWFTFFQAIKISTISIAVVCMSSATLFTAVLEPLILEKKYVLSEFLLGAVIVLGISLIIGFEPKYINGIRVGIISAFLAASFNVLNGKFIQTIPTFQITKFEMLGGFITLSIILLFQGNLNADLFAISNIDWIYLIILGIVCTTVAFLVSVWLMKYLSPFTVSMGINMEPIYAILIALIIDYVRGNNSEKMSFGFYVGTILIIGAIFINGYIKKKKIPA